MVYTAPEDKRKICITSVVIFKFISLTIHQSCIVARSLLLVLFSSRNAMFLTTAVLSFLLALGVATSPTPPLSSDQYGPAVHIATHPTEYPCACRPKREPQTMTVSSSSSLSFIMESPPSARSVSLPSSSLKRSA